MFADRHSVGGGGALVAFWALAVFVVALVVRDILILLIDPRADSE